MKVNKIYVIAAIHGDEPFGLKILGHVRHLGDGKIITQIGHPEAVAKRREYLEENLNRCFGPDASPSKEAKIAKHIMHDIDTHDPDLIIDIHTCECRVGKSVIAGKINQNSIGIAKSLGMEYLIEGIPEVSRQALFGQYPSKGIILEFGLGLRSDRLATTIAKSIAGLLDNKPAPKTKLRVYSKTRCIKNEEIKNEKLRNYVFNEQLGGFPYLVGKNTYTEYAGFLAEKESVI